MNHFIFKKELFNASSETLRQASIVPFQVELFSFPATLANMEGKWRSFEYSCFGLWSVYELPETFHVGPN